MKDRIVRANLLALLILFLASSQLLGLLLGSRVLRGLGAATLMAPLPKVFSDVRGLETFASDFTILYEEDGVTQQIAVTPAFYSRLAGPYNRRNVYGAALSYGPRLPEALWSAVFCHGLEPNGPFRKELGIPARATGVRVRIETKTRERSDSWTLKPRCAR